MRQIFRDVSDWAAEKLGSKVQLQKLLDSKAIKMYRTKEIKATDRDDSPISFCYRFLFDNDGRREKFLAAVAKFPPQYWDPWVRWMKDISSLSTNPWRDETNNVEICVEAQCLIPENELGRFQNQFMTCVTKKLLLEK